MRLDKETSKRFIAAILLASMPLTMSACSKEENAKEEEVVATLSTEDLNKDVEIELVNTTQNNINNLFPNISEEIIEDTTLILLLEELAPKDENEKISADIISKFKSKIDSDNMMDDFNAFLDVLEITMIQENKVIRISDVLPEEMKVDAQILSKVENIVNNILSGNDEDKKYQFNKLYTLFVDEDSLTIDGLEFEIRDLDFSIRAVAQAYARTGAYFSRNHITEEQYSKIDDRTNDQNNKAYIKSMLEVLDNEIDEKSEVDVVDLFNKKYESLETTISGKINISLDTQKNLVDYLNLKYLDSDKVSTKDKNEILSEYEESKVSDVILAIDAITTYNTNSQTIIPFSGLLVEEYKNTATGNIDKIALDFVQYNSIMLLNTVTSESNFNQIFNNPYFQNIYKYFTKQNFTHKYKNEIGTVVETEIIYQSISEGTNFINNEIILYTLNKLSKVSEIESFIKVSQDNMEGSIQYVQNTVTGECENVEYIEYVKTK